MPPAAILDLDYELAADTLDNDKLEKELSGVSAEKIFQKTGIKNRIAGEDQDGSAGVFQSISPVDKSVICDVAHGTAEDIDTAAQAAHNAFADWRDMPATERRGILLKVADGIEARAEEIALCECWDTGQTLRFMSKAALRGAENFRYFADQVVQARDGQHLKSPTLIASHAYRHKTRTNRFWSFASRAISRARAKCVLATINSPDAIA